MKKFCKSQPCSNCPYRKDAPLKHWDKAEFADLLSKDKDMMGASYGCHKNDGTLCTGFVINQDKRGMPSIRLRIELSQLGVRVADLDKLSCKSEMFETIEDMAHANYPRSFKKIKV